jgi:carboxymethylenebutenolidase
MTYSANEQEMLAVLEKHIAAEMQGDMDTTMSTMSANPHLLNVPNMIGGDGYEGVKQFYSNHLVGKFFPPDVKFETVSITVGRTRVVQELVISFTHTVEIEWMIPKIAPTNKKVEIAFVVVAGIENLKLTHEHIYWDQASVLLQLGLLDPQGLPVTGAESARRLLNYSTSD